MTRVKVCGLTRGEDAAAAVDVGADAVGVVCDVPVDSPREVSPERAASIVADVPPFVSTVLVTMPDNPQRAIELVERVEPQAVQIHGGMRPGDLAYLRTNVDARILLAVDAADIASAAGYDGVADGFVVDSVDEDGGGGTGKTHDWDRTREETATLESPVILAGGLTPENVAEAVETVRPFAVDVASGVEARPGEKDHDAIRSFVERTIDPSRPATSSSPRRP